MDGSVKHACAQSIKEYANGRKANKIENLMNDMAREKGLTKMKCNCPYCIRLRNSRNALNQLKESPRTDNYSPGRDYFARLFFYLKQVANRIEKLFR